MAGSRCLSTSGSGFRPQAARLIAYDCRRITCADYVEPRTAPFDKLRTNGMVYPLPAARGRELPAEACAEHFGFAQHRPAEVRK